MRPRATSCAGSSSSRFGRGPPPRGRERRRSELLGPLARYCLRLSGKRVVDERPHHLCRRSVGHHAPIAELDDPLATGRGGPRWIAEDAAVVAWTLTPVELVSALRRLVRDGALVEQAAREAEEVVRDLIARAHIVSDVERVKALTIRVLRVHALRAADALQLGAALAWSDGHTEGAILHTFDKRLAEAASREGFRVRPG